MPGFARNDGVSSSSRSHVVAVAIQKNRNLRFFLEPKMKKFLVILGVVFGLVLIVPTFIDWSHFKDPLAQFVKVNTGYDLKIRGPLRLGLLPVPHLDAQDVSIGGGKNAASLDLKALSLKLKVLPLLQGRLESSAASIQEIDYYGYQFSRAEISFDIQGSDIHIPSFQMEGYGGRLEGDLVWEKKSPVKFNLKVDGINTGDLPNMKASSLKKAILTGTISLAGNDLVSLKGKTYFNLTQGLLEIFDVRKFVDGLKHVRNLQDIEGVIFSLTHKSDVPFEYLRANFTIEAGKACSQDIEFLAEGVSINGKGEISLPQGLLDIQTQIKVKDLESLPPLDLKIEGRIDSPSYKIDQGQLVKVLLKSEIRQRAVDRVVKEVAGKIQGLLKAF